MTEPPDPQRPVPPGPDPQSSVPPTVPPEWDPELYRFGPPEVPVGPPPPPDPLAGAPGAPFEDWFRRLVAVLRRGWRSGLALLAITTVVPALVTAVAGIAAQRYLPQPATQQSMTPAQAMSVLGTTAGLLGLILVVSAAVSFATSIGWAATLWTFTRQAVDRPAPLPDALRYGLRRALPLWGWYLLYSLIVLVGTCFCILPGIYLALALALIAPVAIFEPGEPAITRSFRLVNSRFGPTIGRLLLVGGAVLVYTAITNEILQLLSGAGLPGTIASVVLTAALGLPATLVEIAAVLVTYAESRAAYDPHPPTSETLADAAH